MANDKNLFVFIFSLSLSLFHSISTPIWIIKTEREIYFMKFVKVLISLRTLSLSSAAGDGWWGASGELFILLNEDINERQLRREEREEVNDRVSSFMKKKT